MESEVIDAAHAASLNAFIAADPADVARQQADLPP
jgi:hypothetical protein